MPGDGTGIVVDQHELGRRQCLNAETGILVLLVVADVWEFGVGGQHDVGAAVTLGIDTRLKAPCGGLIADGDIDVLCIVLGVPFGHALINISQAVRTGIVVEGAALGIILGEGDAVVVHTGTLLVVGLCCPPFGSCCSRRTAAQVTDLLVGKAPLLLGDAAEVGTVVDNGVVEGIFLLYATLAEAVAVSQFQLNGVSTGLAVLVTDFLQGRILCAVENPEGIDSGLRGVRGYHLVSLLVDADLEVDAVQRRDALLAGSLETVGRAGDK